LLGQVTHRLAGALHAMSAGGKDPEDLVVVETEGPTISEGRKGVRRHRVRRRGRRSTDLGTAATHKLGFTAGRLLLEEVVGDSDHVHQQVQFAPELVVRAPTTGKKRVRRATQRG
jgi:hypothetical protein